VPRAHGVLVKQVDQRDVEVVPPPLLPTAKAVAPTARATARAVTLATAVATARARARINAAARARARARAAECARPPALARARRVAQLAVQRADLRGRRVQGRPGLPRRLPPG